MAKKRFIPQIEPWIGEEEMEEMKKVLKSTFITENKECEKLENLLRDYTQAKYAVIYSNGTMALFSAIVAAGLKPGDEVIVPDLTFTATANAAILAGVKPIFCDVDAESLQMNRKFVEEKITKNTKGIIPVHLYGNAAQMDDIMDFAKENKMVVIEDAAESIGVRYKGKHVGTIGDAGIISFYGNKTMTMGEGGLILTDKKEIAEKCIRLKNCGRLKKGVFIHEDIGYNFRNTDLNAAIGVAQFKKLPIMIKRKKEMLEKYKELLPAIKFSGPSRDVDFVPWFINIRVDNPDFLAEHLEKEGIGTRRLFPPLHMQPCYQGANYFEGEFAGSTEAYNHGLSLPSSVALTDEQIEYIASKINDYYKK